MEQRFGLRALFFLDTGGGAWPGGAGLAPLPSAYA